MIKGKKIGLVAIEKEDLKQLMQWRNNPEFRKYFREYRELNMFLQEKWYQDRVLRDPSTIMFSIRKLDDNRLIGCCGLVCINWVCRFADLSLYIGWKNLYIDNKGYAEESCRLILDYGFKELGMNKIWNEIYIFDERKKKFYDKLGFKVDGILRDNYFYNGKFCNSYVLSILASEYLSKE